MSSAIIMMYTELLKENKSGCCSYCFLDKQQFHRDGEIEKRNDVLQIEFSEKAMATHSSTLAWKIPWIEGPGGLQSMGSLRVGHD